MYFLAGLIIVLVFLILLFFFYSKIRNRVNFYVIGLDASFSIADLNLLWKVSQICGLDDPNSLFFSLPALTKCMNQITEQAKQNGTENDPKNQILITKLFNYRTKIQNKSDEKKGLESTKFLDIGQKLRVIFPGRGVFVSEIVNNGKDLIISVPKQKEMITFSSSEWVGQVINVYLWRKGDARYVFDTVVLDQAIYIGKPVLKLKHSVNLVRTQKRKSARAKCNIDGDLFVIKEKIKDYTSIETKNGYRCKIEDISESGALIRIGGQGVPNIQIKLQFTINNMLIVMFGEVRTVEYNEEIKQSLLHFECTHIDTPMKNEILKFVFNILPDKEKEIITALTMLNEDEKQESKSENTEDTLNKLENQISESNKLSINEKMNQADMDDSFYQINSALHQQEMDRLSDKETKSFSVTDNYIENKSTNGKIEKQNKNMGIEQVSDDFDQINIF